MRTAAIILAGGTLRAPEGDIPTAHLDFNGRKLYELVVSELRGCPEIDQIVVVGSVPEGEGYISVKPLANDFVSSLGSGISALRVETGALPERILACPVDQPFLNSKSVSLFLRDAEATNGELVYAIASYKECMERWPQMRRTPFPWFTGKATGGNLLYCQTGRIRMLLDFAEKMYPLRKKPLDVFFATMGFMIRRRLKLRLIYAEPCIGADIDSYLQYQQALTYLEQGQLERVRPQTNETVSA